MIYIGTNFAEENFPAGKQTTISHHTLSIAYLGYMRRDKGYFYLINLLENLNSQVSAHIHLTIAAKSDNQYEIERIKKLKNKYASVTYLNGYNHKNIKQILSGVELGIIPVLWEDCLPQVAIEFVCHGVPILTTNLGGAREIANNEQFVFNVNNNLDFYNKIEYFTKHKETLNDFWKTKLELRTLSSHIDEMLSIYKCLSKY